MLDINYKKINKEIELLEFKDEWRRLENSSGMTVFQSFDWFYFSFKEWNNSMIHRLTGEVYIYFIRQDSILKVICPIIVQKKSTKTRFFGIERGIYLQSVSGYTDYNNLIYDKFDDDCVSELISRIKNDFEGLDFYFNHIRDDSDLNMYLEKKKNVPYWTKVYVYVKNNGSIDGYKTSLSKHIRQNLRTAKNRMARDGYSFHIEVIDGLIRDKSLLRKLRNMHIKRYIKKNYDSGLNVFANSKNLVKIILNIRKELFNNIVYHCMMTANNGSLILFLLNNEIAGYLYGLRDARALRIMQNCVIDQFKFYSPSFTGTYDFILYELGHGHSDIDFTRGNEQYKYMLGGTEGNLFSYKL